VKKLIEYIKEYAILIISILILVIMVKNCNASRADKYYSRTKINYELVIDSLNLSISDYKDTIYNLKHENFMLQKNIIDIQKDKEYYRRSNNNLINVTKTLSDRTKDKDTI
jgi:hypothetical protein